MRVLLIGQSDRPEMLPVVNWLRDRTSAETLRRQSSIVATAGNDWHPDLIVVLESHPDEYSLGDINALFATEPLARIVCCAGAWSESAGRTRKHWPLALRVPTTSAIPRLEREWELLAHQQTTNYLPPTGSREEWFAAHHPELAAHPNPSGRRVRLISPDPAYRQMLADALASIGLSLSEPPSDVILYDIDPWQSDRIDDLQKLSETAPVITVTGWITPTDEAALLSAGASAVIPKLGDIHRLLAVIEHHETLVAIREGLADIEAGRTRPAEEVLNDLKARNL